MGTGERLCGKTSGVVKCRVFGWILVPGLAFFAIVRLVPIIQSDWSGDIWHREILGWITDGSRLVRQTGGLNISYSPCRLLVRLDTHRGFLTRCARLPRQPRFKLQDPARLLSDPRCITRCLRLRRHCSCAAGTRKLGETVSSAPLW